MVERFSDDQGYVEWVKAHPDAFVLNLRQRADPDYVVLHRATCWTISAAGRGTGAYTQRAYRKVGGVSVEELRAVARQEGRIDGSFSKCCALCEPLGER